MRASEMVANNIRARIEAILDWADDNYLRKDPT